MKLISIATSFFFIASFFTAKLAFAQGENAKYKINMRVGIAGTAPIAFSSIAKSGKKTSIVEISDDGRSETMIELIAKKSVLNNKPGIWMDVTVSRKVNGKEKANEKTQLFTYENQESEVNIGSNGKGKDKLSLAVVAFPETKESHIE